MEFGTPEFPKSGNVEKGEFKNPYLKEGEILLGNFEKVDESSNFAEGQAEDDRIKFKDIKYSSKREIPAYDINGKELPNMYAVAVNKEEYEKNNKN